MSEKKKNSLIPVAKTPTQKPNLLKATEQNEEASVKAKQPKKAGRKPIPASERETEAIQVKITKAQKKVIESLAGHIPLSVFSKLELKKNGIL